MSLHGMKNRYAAAVAVSAVVALAAVVLLAVTLLTSERGDGDGFIPPPFEAAAVAGMPDVPAELGYSRIYREGMDFSVWVCGNITADVTADVTADGRSATVYLTNPAENDLWMKLRLLDAEGTVLGETGLIRPGEYVERVALNRELVAGTEIQLKIMTYEPHTYYSAGAVSLRTRVGASVD